MDTNNKTQKKVDFAQRLLLALLKVWPFLTGLIIILEMMGLSDHLKQEKKMTFKNALLLSVVLLFAMAPSCGTEQNAAMAAPIPTQHPTLDITTTEIIYGASCIPPYTPQISPSISEVTPGDFTVVSGSVFFGSNANSRNADFGFPSDTNINWLLAVYLGTGEEIGHTYYNFTIQNFTPDTVIYKCSNLAGYTNFVNALLKDLGKLNVKYVEVMSNRMIKEKIIANPFTIP